MARELILLAEDDESTRRLYVQFLNSESYRIISAANGREALEQLDRFRPDLVLLDIMMPELDGIAACRQIRAKFGDAVPILFLTVLNQLDTLRQAIEAGGDDFIVKSGDLKPVLDRIRHWSGGRKAETPRERRAAALASISRLAAGLD